MKFRFPPEARLRRKSDFDRTFKTGRRSSTPILLVVASRDPSREAERPRIGLAVSRKCGNAVVRNVIRRRLKEIFRLAQPRLLPGWDFVVVTRPACAKASYEELRHALHACWERLGAIE